MEHPPPNNPASAIPDSISKIVPIVRKPEVKKKHKEAIDPTVGDLFKAEPFPKRQLSTVSYLDFNRVCNLFICSTEFLTSNANNAEEGAFRAKSICGEED